MPFQIPFKFSGSSADATIAGRARPSRMGAGSIGGVPHQLTLNQKVAS